MDICSGFGVNMICYDPYPIKDSNYHYVSLEEIFKQSDIISLHCPLTKESQHLINQNSLNQMKEGVFIINTSRGALIDSEALLEAIKSRKVGAAALDVYEEEADLFYEDKSNNIIQDDVLARLISMPNVLVTSHQAFLTHEALSNIASTTMKNLDEYYKGEFLENEVCYHCLKDPSQCHKRMNKSCF
jgi:D-lactate dehydrogenase